VRPSEYLSGEAGFRFGGTCVHQFANAVAETLEHSLHQRKLVPFCGAGISLPSGIPLVSDLKWEIARHIAGSESVIDAIGRSAMPFEEFMQILVDHTDCRSLFGVFEVGKPSVYHHFLAKLVREGYLRHIVTTNFDLHIEAALQSEGVAFDVLYTDAQLSEFDWTKADRATVLKLHGTIADRDNLGATMRRVAAAQMVRHRESCVQELFGRSYPWHVLVVGYSFSDQFDINPNIASIDKPQGRVTFIQHVLSSTQCLSRSLVESGLSTLTGLNGEFIECATESLVRLLWTRLLSEPFPRELACADDKEWRTIVSEWASQVRSQRGARQLLAGSMLRREGKYDLSNVELEQCLEQAHGVHFAHRSVAFQMLGDNLSDMGRPKEAIAPLREALHTMRPDSDEERARCLTSLGVALERLQQYRASIRIHRRALRCVGSKHAPMLRGICLSNLGIALKNSGKKTGREADIREALSVQQDALAIGLDSGDIRSVCRAYGNLGIIHSLLGNAEDMQANYSKAIRYSGLLQDEVHTAIWTFNIGYDLRTIDRAGAREHLLDALQRFRQLKRESDVRYCEGVLAEMGKR
jgi:tetratricopeptide (TPR) repeat protein